MPMPSEQLERLQFPRPKTWWLGVAFSQLRACCWAPALRLVAPGWWHVC